MTAPNILLITTDQQRWDTLHCGGNPHIFTPHLNWLADTGVSFTRAYSDCPVCMPARATVMTGMPAYVHGATANTDAEPMRGHDTLPGMLVQAGYQTRAQGKMHFHPMRKKFGFEEMETSYDYYRFMDQYFPGQSGSRHGQGQNELEPIIGTAGTEHTLSRWVVNRSIDFMETRDEERPFFLWTSFSKPHPPFDPSLPFWEIYRGMPMPEAITGDWSASPEKIPPGFMRMSSMLGNGYRFGPEQLQQIRRAYYACISEVDAALGLLFARMRELGLLDNTWIMFTSDHGEMLGDHYMSGKGLFFEGAAHVPMLIRPPGQFDQEALRGNVCNEIVCLQDILPTVLNLADIGEKCPEEAQGFDLREMATGQNKRENLIGVCGDIYAVTSKEWKYHYCAAGNDCLLFNLMDDPEERRDLSKAHPERCKEMHHLLLEELKDYSHLDLNDGQIPIKKALSIEDERRWNSWPGFHSTDVETDMLH